MYTKNQNVYTQGTIRNNYNKTMSLTYLLHTFVILTVQTVTVPVTNTAVSYVQQLVRENY